MTDYFKKYSSNTAAGSANQSLFDSDGKPHRARIFYKISSGGKYGYSFLFGNSTDSTYGSGFENKSNTVTSGWSISDMTVCVCKSEDESGKEVSLTFDGKASKTVDESDIFFCTDEAELDCKKGDFLRLDFTYCGKKLPNHEESIILSRLYENGEWVQSKNMPFPLEIGCRKEFRKRIGFLGDSITQGIGTELNSYTHTNAVIAGMLGEDYAVQNLGIGYARAADAATDGAWLERAKHSDLVVVCFGVNDMFNGHSADSIKNSLTTITRLLKEAGAKVIVQTVPPFDYGEEYIPLWKDVNNFILSELPKEADGVFDDVPVLRLSPEKDNIAKYGGHPNAEGCKKWAEALLPVIEKLI